MGRGGYKRGGHLKLFLEKEGVDNDPQAAQTPELAWGPVAQLSAETWRG